MKRAHLKEKLYFILELCGGHEKNQFEKNPFEENPFENNHPVIFPQF